MEFVSIPLSFSKTDSGTLITRSLEERISMLDNLVELIVFTPRGSFDADPDFGFEYWNHEFSNVNYREFNNEQTGMAASELYNEITKKECKESIRQSLAVYAPQLKDVRVSMQLDLAPRTSHLASRSSKYVVNVKVEGSIRDEGLVACEYEKDVSFLIEPTVKKYSI